MFLRSRKHLASVSSALLDSTSGNWLVNPQVAECHALKWDTTQSHFNKNKPCMWLLCTRNIKQTRRKALWHCAYSAVASHYSSKLKFRAKWLNSLPHNISGNNKKKILSQLVLRRMTHLQQVAFLPPFFPHRFLSLYPISHLLVYLDCLSSLASSSSFSPHPCFHCCSPSRAHFMHLIPHI